MGLTLASEAGFLASAQGIVRNEAADAPRLVWAATSPRVNSAPIQSALLDYLPATRACRSAGETYISRAGPRSATQVAICTRELRPSLLRML